MRTRDVFIATDFHELNQLFLHLDYGLNPPAYWWRAQVLAWCRTSAITKFGDLRPHVVSLIDRMLELGWSDDRLHRLLDHHVIMTFKLGHEVTVNEFLADVQNLIRADLWELPVGGQRRRASGPTKLHALLKGKTQWDDATWFQAERYLLENFTRPGMLLFVTLAGCTPTGSARYFKTDALKLLHELPPSDVLRAWDQWRGR